MSTDEGEPSLQRKRAKKTDSDDDNLIACMNYSQPADPSTDWEHASGVSESPSTMDVNPLVTKRLNAICWDDYFMGIAFLSAQRSKDPNTQVGACIVDDHKMIVGIGYNGFPKGCSDDELPWARNDGNKNDPNSKYPYVVHVNHIVFVVFISCNSVYRLK